MGVGDIVKWNKFLGIIVGTDLVKQSMGVVYLVSWADGGVSCMYMDELVVISE
mgnify:FL=1